MDDPYRTLTEELADRRAATPGERRAAQWLVDRIRRSTYQVWLEPFRSFRTERSAWMLLLAAALTGGLLGLWAPLPGLGISLAAALGFAAQALGWVELGWFFPGGESQNVVGVVPAAGEIRQRLVVVAHYDTGRRTWSWPAFLVTAASVMLLPPAAILPLAMPGPLWRAVILLPLGGAAAGLAALLGPGRPVQNAAGVAAALVLSRGEPLRHTEIWTLFSGARLPGLVGIRAFLRRHGRLLADARFVVLEEEREAGATLWQSRGEASVIADRGNRSAVLLTVSPADVSGAASRVRRLAEELDRLAETGA